MNKSFLKKWKKRHRLIWLMIFMLIGSVLTTSMLSKREALAAEVMIEIKPLKNGGALITTEQVKTLLEAKFPTKDPDRISRVPLKQLEEAINAHPLVQHADVYVDARNRVRVRIEQPEPLIRVIDGHAASYYLDAEGRRIPLSTAYTPRVMVATGSIPPYRDSILNYPDHVLSQLVQLSAHVEQDEFVKALIEQVYVKNKEIYLVPKMGQFEILLGDASQLEAKFRRLKAFYQHVLPSAGWDKYELVNLAYKGQIVCRKVSA
ncbi:MAG: hypothetical protein R2787_01000 [Saprospiraceae bacterium]